MKWYTKLLVFLAIGTLLFVIFGFSYVIRAKYQMNEYNIQLGVAFNAATFVNATETFTDEENAVIATYEGKSAVIVPENYKALQSYLRRDYAMPPFGKVKDEGALHISICGESHLYIQGDKDGQGALLRLDTDGKSFLMHVTGGDLWEKILKVSMDGRNDYPNIPLE